MLSTPEGLDGTTVSGLFICGTKPEQVNSDKVKGKSVPQYTGEWNLWAKKRRRNFFTMNPHEQPNKERSNGVQHR